MKDEINGRVILDSSAALPITRTNLKTQEQIVFNFLNQPYIDDTVEQGVPYEYSTGEIYRVDFEDIILSDEQHLLRIVFNPNISSFKTNILETKVETLGSKFPFFVRNGSVFYKEFLLTGLISYESGGIGLFYNKNQIEDDFNIELEIQDFSFNGEKFYQERLIKRDIESWLVNGKPKLMRSAAEGNFIIRLTNVNLTPFDKTSRLVHTFSATGIEIADYNQENLELFGLIPTKL